MTATLSHSRRAPAPAAPRTTVPKILEHVMGWTLVVVLAMLVTQPRPAVTSEPPPPGPDLSIAADVRRPGLPRPGSKLNISRTARMPAPRARGTERSLARRAELIAIGRKLFADTSYDALSMDDIARQAQCRQGADLLLLQVQARLLPRDHRGLRRRPGHLRGERPRTAAGGPGPAHHRRLSALRRAQPGRLPHDRQRRRRLRRRGARHPGRGARGDRRDHRRRRVRPTRHPPLARMALLGWVCSVEGATLDWIDRPRAAPATTMRELLVKTLGGTDARHRGARPRLPGPGGRPAATPERRRGGRGLADRPPPQVPARRRLVDRLDQLAVRRCHRSAPRRTCRPGPAAFL